MSVAGVLKKTSSGFRICGTGQGLQPHQVPVTGTRARNLGDLYSEAKSRTSESSPGPAGMEVHPLRLGDWCINIETI